MVIKLVYCRVSGYIIGCEEQGKIFIFDWNSKGERVKVFAGSTQHG